MVGYGVSVGVGYLVIKLVTEELVRKFGRPGYGYVLPALVGIFERILYTSAWIVGFKEFIVWWLLAKVGAGWIWQTWRPDAQEKQDASARYNIFLIGNALSIMFGGLGALIISYWPEIIRYVVRAN